MRNALVFASVLSIACSRSVETSTPAQPPTTMDAVADSPHANEVRWEIVEGEVESLICMMTFEGDPPIQQPVYGSREDCKLPPASTQLERAVEQAYADANPLLSAMHRDLSPRVIAALEHDDPEERLRASRAAYLDGRFLGVLVAHLLPALAEQELTCVDCPAPYEPPSRTVSWETFSTYLAAYAWPDPVVTPTDARGRPAGKPKYSMHVCVGLNGVDEIPSPDTALVELAFLTAFETEPFLERAPALYQEIRRDPAFLRLETDEERTRWLRDELGPRLVAEPELRRAVCQTVHELRSKTGITIDPCEPEP
jgi:hypothetical protein